MQNQNQTLLFVGIGNVLRTDDGAGVYISERINERNHIRRLTVEVSIENYIQKINSYNADNIILIDSVSELLDFTTNTHNISLKNISEFFTSNVRILGIQPETIKFGEGLSVTVKKSADEVVRFINAQKSSMI